MFAGVDVVGEVVHVVVAGEQDDFICILFFEVDDVVKVDDLVAGGDIERVEVVAEKDEQVRIFFEGGDCFPVGPPVYVADDSCFHVLWFGFSKVVSGRKIML